MLAPPLTGRFLFLLIEMILVRCAFKRFLSASTIGQV